MHAIKTCAWRVAGRVGEQDFERSAWQELALALMHAHDSFLKNALMSPRGRRFTDSSSMHR